MKYLVRHSTMQCSAKQSIAGEGKGRVWVEEDRVVQGVTGQDRTGQDRARQGSTGQGKVGRGSTMWYRAGKIENRTHRLLFEALFNWNVFVCNCR